MFRIRIHSTNRQAAATPAARLALTFLLVAGSGAVYAQSLNWEGQTGVFVTPLAYTAASPKNNIGRPIVAYHYLNGGEVLGGFHTASVTVGLAARTEFGYTRTFHQAGDTAGLSPLWKGGFNIVHGKINLLPENVGKHNWAPALSAGFVARTQVNHVSGVLAGKKYNNADFYLVATKTVTQVKGLPLVFNLATRRPTHRSSGWRATLPRTRDDYSARSRSS
jgi:hypothetical protein